MGPTSKCLKLVAIKLHVHLLCPSIDFVEILLENDYVSSRCDGSASTGVICERCHSGVVVRTIGDVLDEHEEEDWAKDCSLGHSTGDGGAVRMMTLHNHSLFSVVEEGMQPDA